MNLILLFVPFSLAGSPALSTVAEGLLNRQLTIWSNPEERASAVDPMRRVNPEWDLMGRTFLVLGISSVALADPSREAALLPVIDRILSDTIRSEAEHGQAAFLLPYATTSPWKTPSARSLFVDGEIAMMIGARRLVEDDGKWNDEHHRRINTAVSLIAASPSLLGESYPDEAWLFCNTIALAAVSVYDSLEKDADHSKLIERWVNRIRGTQRDPQTGLLVSSTTYAGERKDGPEGSSVWMSAHMLQFFAPDFAREQYDLARPLLGRTLLGMGYALEWPPGQEGRSDVDAGEVMPGLGASTASSGLAIIAARAFGDQAWHAALLRSLSATAQPSLEDGQLRYLRGNAVGDAVIFYGMVEGPLREAQQARQKRN